MIAVAEDQNADGLIFNGDRFVLNILKEGRTVRKHFSHRFVAGENPFASLATHMADNGCLILSDAFLINDFSLCVLVRGDGSSMLESQKISNPILS
jgi:flavin reductase (DIM6/NTAB) family NADH-FMN oxidoreductase RutF